MSEQVQPGVKKFVITDDMRMNCEIYKVDSRMKAQYMPLHSDFLKAFLDQESIPFSLYLLSGWDLVEYIKPISFTADKMKELLAITKEYPLTRIAIKRDHFGMYENIMNKFRMKRLAAFGESAQDHIDRGVVDSYWMLSNASQRITKGTVDEESFYRLSYAVTQYVKNPNTTRDVINFLSEIVGKDPLLYDHAACTAMVAVSISFLSLQLPKRESKLTMHGALMHDLERNCSYLFKASNPKAISEQGIREVKAAKAKGVQFHDSTHEIMEQYREHFAGNGFPNRRRGKLEEEPSTGISRMARVVAIACGFTEYLLKRQEGKPLTLERILELLKDRGGSEFDPHIIKEFISDIEKPKSRDKKTYEEDQNDDLIFEFKNDYGEAS